MSSTDIDRAAPIAIASIESLLEYITSEINTNGRSASCCDPEDSLHPLISAFLAIDSSQALYVTLGAHDNFTIASELPQVDEDASLLVVFLKPSGPLRSDMALSSQINVLRIPLKATRDSPDKMSPTLMKDFLNYVVTPYFDCIASGNGDSDGSKYLQSAKKKLHDFSVSLDYVDMQIAVPDLLSVVPVSTLARLRQPFDENSLQDTRFLNELTQIANTWIKQVQSITRMPKNTSKSWSISAEINHWTSMENVLRSLRNQLEQAEVRNAIEILSVSKRFQTTFAFQNSLHITETLEEAQIFNAFFKDLPIGDLKRAKDSPDPLQAFDSTISALFSHLRRWKSLESLPLQKMIDLTELLLSDISQNLIEILISLSLMSMSLQAFSDLVYLKLQSIFDNVQDATSYMTNILREVMRKRSEKFRIIRINLEAIEHVQERIRGLKKIKSKHHALLNHLAQLSDDASLTDIVLKAFNKHVIAADYLDLHPQGALLWASEENRYLEVYSTVQERLALSMNAKVSQCIEFDDFVGFFRTVEESSSLSSVLDDNHKVRFLQSALKEIQDLKTCAGGHLACFDTSRSDLPNLSDFAKSMRQVIALKLRVDTISSSIVECVGENWSFFTFGSQLADEIAHLKRAMDPIILSDVCISQAGELLGKSFLHERLVVIKNDDTQKTIEVTSFANLVHLPLLLSTLSTLGHSLPSKLATEVRRVEFLLPLSLALGEHVEIFNIIISDDRSDNGLKAVLEPLKNEAFCDLQKLSLITWETVNNDAAYIEGGIGDIGSETITSIGDINSFLEKAYKLFDFSKQIDNFNDSFGSELFESIMSCEFTRSAIQEHVDRVYDAAIKLASKLEGVEVLEESLSKMLTNSLQEKLKATLAAFVAEAKGEVATTATCEKSYHVLQFQDGNFFVEPPLSSIKVMWVTRINHFVNAVSKVTFANFNGASKNIIGRFPSDIKHHLKKTITEIDALLVEANAQMSTWNDLSNVLSHDLTSGTIFDGLTLEESLQKASQTLRLKSLFSSPKRCIEIGNCIEISYSRLQKQIVDSYERFEAVMLDHFTKITLDQASTIIKSLKLQEAQFSRDPNWSVDFRAILKFVYDLLESKESIVNLRKIQNVVGDCSKLLIRNKRTLPTHWVYAEEFENRIANLASMISSRLLFIDHNLDLFQVKMTSEMNHCNKEVDKIATNWLQDRPITGSMEPGHALSILDKIQKRLDDLEYSRIRLTSVASRLNLVIPEKFSFKTLQEDLDDMRVVWRSLKSSWSLLEEIKMRHWSEVQPKKMKVELDDLLSGMRALPSMVRQYSAFSILESKILSYIGDTTFLVELKDDSLKLRHWKKIFEIAGLPTESSLQSLRLHHLLESGLKLHEASYRAILKQAREEKVVEEALQSISNSWSTIVFETFDFNGRCRLIRNWSHLYEACQENLDTLSNIKDSVWHGEFEEQRASLESKMIELVALFDIWIEVQKSWVYLDGIFGKNPEMKASLPTESARFNNISLEFFNILKRVFNLSLVIEILTVRDLKSTLFKLQESLQLTTKGLADYLERQRDMFPRFYFLGNDDLLEFMGNSSDMKRINRHIRSMFFGIESLNFDKESHSITGINSPEGESLELINPISLIKYAQLHQWLTELEAQVKVTVAHYIEKAYIDLQSLLDGSTMNGELNKLIATYPCQAVTMAFALDFGARVQQMAHNSSSSLVKFYDQLLNRIIALPVDTDVFVHAKKIEFLILDLTFYRNLSEELASASQSEKTSLLNRNQIFLHQPSNADPLDRIVVTQGRHEMNYGFEYQGVVDKLALTPLVSKCYLSMTQALAQGLGGSPFGPAGTGKTESIKALGLSLGRMVMVFNCDESFDYKSMERIFLGLSKVGCWGCFDEFNRLDSSILSAISSSIEAIQRALNGSAKEITMLGREVSVHPFTGLFVTMNPGYAGRNELPENLKRLFRSFGMENPDMELIVEALLASQKMANSKELSSRIVKFFDEITSKASSQRHYDFGLRAIKVVLRLCGSKRALGTYSTSMGDEATIVSRSLKEAILPKLVSQDVSVFDQLLKQYFREASSGLSELASIRENIKMIASTEGIATSENLVEKALQICEMQKSHHGMMLVGEPGTGKSTLLSLALKALSDEDNRMHETFVLDCKILSKEDIFGSLDQITREWTDGLLTKYLRKVILNMKGEQSHRIWIIFDGDVDPEWAENLNSVLDDNKVLTLPNGERLELPTNTTIVFEVDNIENATLATISRCGMIWFDCSIVTPEVLWKRFLYELRNHEIDLHYRDSSPPRLQRRMELQKVIADSVSSFEVSFFTHISSMAKHFDHIMSYTFVRALSSFFKYFRTQVTRLLEFGSEGITASSGSVDEFVLKAVFLSLVWAFSGDCSRDQRLMFCHKLAALPEFTRIDIPSNVFEYEISLSNFEWSPIHDLGTIVDLDPHQVMDPTTIVPTVDIAVHENLIYSLVNSHSPLLLCGPPGSGKTMTFLEAIRKSPNLELVSLNFSKDTTPMSLIRSLEQHCSYRRTNRGLSLAPKISGKWTVVFCDEINLPSADKYGTQKVISLIRQMVERGGFWSVRHHEWVSLNSVQFVGACNDPNDPGRRQLPERFLRHVCVVMVDYPGETSMSQIYESFNSSALKCAPRLRGFAKPLTAAMLDVYFESKRTLTSTVRSHYIYSPRELTRWCRGILETLLQSSYEDVESLVRLWYHEGLRLFSDRISEDSDKIWTRNLLRNTAEKHFVSIEVEEVLKEPVLYSSWMSATYESIPSDELYNFVREKLRVYGEEELKVDLILFEDMLDHVLRIDRVLRQHQGHMILVGPCSSGKTTLTKFVAWMNGIRVVQLLVHKGYTIQDFQEKLREILTACLLGEKICFLIDESSLLETSFIERMNTLLANSEIPGLFEGEEFRALMNLCETESTSQGHLLDNDDELYSWFRAQVSANLHVVFTLSNVNSRDRVQINSSPALFNRCVLNWMGKWSQKSLNEIAAKTFETVALDWSRYTPPISSEDGESNIVTFRDAIVGACVFIHNSTKTYPNTFMRLLASFKKIYSAKDEELNMGQRHIISGLDKIKEAVLEITSMKEVLSEKQETLSTKEADAKKLLDNMIQNQNEAERKREFSIATQEELEKQEVQINKRRAYVINELELVEPDVLAAQRGVQNIKKQHLTEIRSMSNPPAAVKMAMESVCVLLGYDVSTWRDVQLVVRKDDFIASIVAFDSEVSLSVELREHMERRYLRLPEYNYESVNRASKACGPLLQWVIAQLKYHSILEKVLPLKEEVEQLEAAAKHSKAQLIAIAEMIQELEESITEYKASYSNLIREAERVRVEMEDIKRKVVRSVNLIESLKEERKRWESNVSHYDKDRECIAGNSLLSAAFATYCGQQDQTERESSLLLWKSRLEALGIPYDENFKALTYLSSNKAEPKKHGISSFDLLWEQNFAIKDSSDFTYVVDPTEDALEGLLSREGKKIRTTSFLDGNFMRHIEDALRFGATILVTHAELYDPRLDPILRKDIKDTGGRKTIQLEKRIVDVSDNFNIMFYTKDQYSKPPEFLASRVNILNFTITRGNIQGQTLDICLKQISPDLYQKERELSILHNEFSSRSYRLRQQLLNILSGMAGTILEDDEAANTLDTIKREALALEEQLQASGEIITESENIKNTCKEFSIHLSRIYEILMRLSSKHKLYNFSFKVLLAVLESVLSQNRASVVDRSLIQKFYQMVYATVGSSLKSFDRSSLALALTLSSCLVATDSVTAHGLRSVAGAIGSKSNLPELASLLEKCFDINFTGLDEAKWLAHISGECGTEDFAVIRPLVKELLGSGSSWSNAIDEFEVTAFGMPTSRIELLSFPQLVSKGKNPILVAESDHIDLTPSIESLALASSRKLEVVAMGTEDSLQTAFSALRTAMKSGSWLVLQNVHLSGAKLNDLEQVLSVSKPKDGFALFLTCSLATTDIPPSLIASSSLFVYEETPTFKKVLLESFEVLLKQLECELRIAKTLCLLMSWYHGIILERLKYVPVSFSQRYDANEVDLKSAGSYLKRIFDSLSKKVIVKPLDIPWKEISYVIGIVIYGGKMSTSQDANFCRDLADQVFKEASFDEGYTLPQANSLRMPQDDGEGLGAYKSWISSLPDQTPLEWIGLDKSSLNELEDHKLRAITKAALELVD